MQPHPRCHRRVTSLVLAALLVACGPTGTPRLEVSQAVAAEPAAGSSQIMLSITNDGDGDDTLVGATTPAALGVELHETRLEEQRASMEELDTAPLPAGTTTDFRPGGLHLMMVVPDETVSRGGTFALTLHFDRSADLTVPVDVVSYSDLADDAFDDEPQS